MRGKEAERERGRREGERMRWKEAERERDRAVDRLGGREAES